MYDIKIGTLQACMIFHCANALVVLRICWWFCGSGGSADLVVLRICWWFCGSGGSADLRTSEGTLVTRESARFDEDIETKSQVRLLKFHKKSKIF